MTGWLLSALLLLVWFSPQAQFFRSLPNRLSIAHGQPAALEAPFPLTLDVSASEAQALAEADPNAQTATATISLFGLLPLREVEIDISDDLRLYPGGQAVGVAMHTQGVLVVGTSDLTGANSPARLAGLKPGDLITLAIGGWFFQHAAEKLLHGHFVWAAIFAAIGISIAKKPLKKILQKLFPNKNI